MRRYVQLLFTWPVVVSGTTAASAGALGAALVAQYGFHITPCILCWMQRIPFALGVVIGLCALWWLRGHWRAAALIALTLIYLSGAGLALFHTGVEQHWWDGTRGCKVNLHKNNVFDDTPQDLAARVEALWTQNITSCDRVTWSFLGLSMAAWNIFFSLGLTGWAMGGFVRHRLHSSFHKPSH